MLLRSSLNVPIADNQIKNHFRITRAIPTLEYLVKAGARVILCAHIGREKENTLEPIFTYLQDTFTIHFSDEVVGPHTKEMQEGLKDGEILMLENLRRDPREQKNDADFARSLADLAELYVNDAFAASHREHASLIGVPAFLPTYFGINFLLEYEELQKAEKPESPSLFILGGAKFETKMPLVEKFLDLYDHVFVGGALANDFFKAKGIEIGKSLISDVDLTGSPLLSNEKILLPKDLVVRDDSGATRVVIVEDVRPDETIVDSGPATIQMLELFIRNAKIILWNGPLGNYEAGFNTETLALATLLANAPGRSMVGGGDTVAAIESLGFQDKYTYLSGAGGAMLTFLEKGSLPAIDVVVKK